MMNSTTSTTKASPRDFFLWLGAVITLYGSIIAFIALLFEYVNRAFPDPLAYAGDPYGSSVRVSMAALVVLVPTALVVLRIIRRTIANEPGRADIWVRKWALVLTLFIAGATVVIDLITLITTFLGGEISERFLLKVVIVLLVALGVSLHFLADLRGYWAQYPKRAAQVGYAVGALVLAAIIAGFFIIGTPQDIRLMRYDQEKLNNLQEMQYQVVTYWQQKETLPPSLSELGDPLGGYVVPFDPQTREPYHYEATGSLSFTLCATFNRPAPDTAGRGAYSRTPPYPGEFVDETWNHTAGENCFDRTIDPERYPPYEKPRPI